MFIFLALFAFCTNVDNGLEIKKKSNTVLVFPSISGIKVIPKFRNFFRGSVRDTCNGAIKTYGGDGCFYR